MDDHQPNGSEISPLAAAVCSCFRPDGVSVGLNLDYRPCGQAPLPTQPSLQAAGSHMGKEVEVIEGSLYSIQPSRITHFTSDIKLSDRVTPLLQTGTSLSQSGSLSHGTGESMRRIFNPSLDRKGHSCHDILLLPERLCLEDCCAPCEDYGMYRVSV